ncbi:MAG: helicase-exonuclease AddAB subunit AddB [Clostridia bacterium]|jgi:ATP-dependent helicase/nuclease subunit B|nr:helicase-exonuclease AddAB subunit AddB [Clostridia bacterium]
MSLRFIIGRAGTGKTHRCIAEIAARHREDPQKTLIYLVPEQATFYTEKNLLEDSGLAGTMRVQVLSFQRLAWRVLQETGGGVHTLLNEVGKSLIVRRLLDQDRNEYKAFARVMDTPGFILELLKGLAELKTYQVSPQQLSEGVAALPDASASAFRLKLADLSRLYSEYAQYILNKYLDAEGFLEKLIRKLPQAAFLEGAEVWLDGFNGFTPQEYEIIRCLLGKAARVNVALCLRDEDRSADLDEMELLYPAWETWRRLQKIAAQIGCLEEQTLVLSYGKKHRFTYRRELAQLEASFFDTDIPADVAEGISLLQAANRRVEVEGTAQEILRLCREKGYRFGDIAVFFREYAPYENLLPAVFADYSIPYFLDQKKPLAHHPLLDLLSAALEIVEGGWKYEAVFRYLKTDLVSVSRTETDLLENYCLAHGVSGKRWLEPWRILRHYSLREKGTEALSAREERELKRLNKAREKAAAALARLEAKTKAAANAGEITGALHELLLELGVAGKLESWSKKAEAEGRLDEAQLHSRVWQKTLELFEQLIEVLGDQQLKMNEYNRIVQSGLEAMEVGLVPLGLDQVLVGTLGRSRNPHVRAVFILGANEGVFPARISEDSLFGDEERKALQRVGVELGPGSEKLLFAEQLLIYQSLTRASDFLQLSCPIADEEGRALFASSLFGFIRRPVRYLQAEPDFSKESDFLAHPVPALGYLAAGLRRLSEGESISPLWGDVYDWFAQRTEWRKRLQLVTSGLVDKNSEKPLAPRLVRSLYGKKLLTSVSKLERFQACPFSYFLKDGLSLKEREEYKLKAPDLGNFFHAALENSYNQLRAAGLQLADLTDGQMQRLVTDVVGNLAPQLQNELLLSTARHRYLTRKLQRTALRALRTLREHEKKGTFRPVGLEIDFGQDAKLPGLTFTLQDGTVLILQGRIDRVDAAAGDGGVYLRIIDFKSGQVGLSLLEIFYGLKLQLLAYLQVALAGASRLVDAEAKPGGVLYFRIRDPLVLGEGPLEEEEIEKRIMKQLKMSGYVLKDEQVVRLMDREIDGYSDLIPAAMKKDGAFYQNFSEQLLTAEEFAQLSGYVEKVLQEIGAEIMAGNVTISPYRFKGLSPCRYCPYHPVCRFDPASPGESYRDLPLKEPKEVWQAITGTRGGAAHGLDG